MLLSSFSCLLSRMHSCSLASSSSWKCFAHVRTYYNVLHRGTGGADRAEQSQVSCLCSSSGYLRLSTGRGAEDGQAELLLQRPQLLLLLAALATQLTLQEPGRHKSQHQTRKQRLWRRERSRRRTYWPPGLHRKHAPGPPPSSSQLGLWRRPCSPSAGSVTQ